MRRFVCVVASSSFVHSLHPTEMKIAVYEGEHSLSAHNQLLGYFTITNSNDAMHTADEFRVEVRNIY